MLLRKQNIALGHVSSPVATVFSSTLTASVSLLCLKAFSSTKDTYSPHQMQFYNYGIHHSKSRAPPRQDEC